MRTNLQKIAASLVCPETKIPLQLLTLNEAEHLVGKSFVPRTEVLNAKGELSSPVGRTNQVLLREDLSCAYPIVDDIPILLVPEALTTQEKRRNIDLTDARYAEVYEETAHYNKVASQEAREIIRSNAFTVITPAIGLNQAEKEDFPNPKERWIDAIYDCAAQWEAYRHLSPIQGRCVLQLGGKGMHAVKFLLSGAEEGWLITPMLGEALCARALAKEVGVEDQLRCIVAIAEELPILTGTLDAIYSGGCLHHMRTELAIPEAARVLREGGKFAAVDPWRAPLYAIGTKILGKREASVYCTPLTKKRLEPLQEEFAKVEVVHHGTLTRYPFLALSKFGVNNSLSVVWNLGKLDDAICSVIPGLRAMGSSIAILGSKGFIE